MYKEVIMIRKNMNDLMNYEVYIFDYEGTLSVSPNKKLTLKELLYSFDFKKLNTNTKIQNFCNSLKNKEFYVVGIIECNKEIEQKKQWLKLNFPAIKEENYIFISSDYKKSEAIKEIINEKNYEKDKILFIDDNILHVNDVGQLGIRSILADDIIKM